METVLHIFIQIGTWRVIRIRERSIEHHRNRIDFVKLTAKQAMDAMKVSVKDSERYMAGL